jgi:hypothetical protein
MKRILSLLLLSACVKETATEGEACHGGRPDQLVGIIGCVRDLECCSPEGLIDTGGYTGTR